MIIHTILESAQETETKDAPTVWVMEVWELYLTVWVLECYQHTSISLVLIQEKDVML
jgi:hypothetical protein